MTNNPHPTLLSHRLKHRLKKTGLALAVLVAAFLAACSTESSSTTPDTPAPVKPPLAAPQNLTATVYSATAVELRWQAVSNATGYTVYYSSTQNFKVAAASSKMGITNLSTNVGGLTTDTAYYFRVKAVDSSNRFSDSPLSAEATATPAGLATPGKVKPPLAAPQNLAASIYSATAVQLSWQAVSNATGYTVYYSSTQNFKVAAASSKMGITNLSTNVGGLTTDTAYYFRVKAVDSSNRFSDSPLSVEATATPARLATAGKVKATNAAANSRALKWAPVTGAASYTVEYSKTLTWTKPNLALGGTVLKKENITGTNIEITGLEDDLYSFRVKAHSGTETSSGPITAIPRNKAQLQKAIKIKYTGYGAHGFVDTAAGATEDLNYIDTGQVANFNQLFGYRQHFNGDLSQWDTSKVTTMREVFLGASAFNQNISRWDTSQVTDMREMFVVAKAFNQDISRWNTSQVTDMTDMFRDAAAFDQNLSGWDVSSVTAPTDKSFVFKLSPLATKENYWPSAWQK